MANGRKACAGFSLLELTAVMVLLGLLMAVAIPRLDAGRSVEELGFPQRVMADLRAAQRRAQADRCEVRVTIGAGGFSAWQRATLCGGAFNRPVAGAGAAGSVLGGPPPPGIPLSASPATFYFDASGAAIDAVGGSPADVVIDAGARQIRVTGPTGYVSF